jgi:hypothetical protein
MVAKRVKKSGKKSAKYVKDLPIKTLGPARGTRVKGGYRGRYEVKLDQSRNLLKP